MPRSFPNVNLGNYFNNVWAPGASPFKQALDFYQGQLRQNAAGGGISQLAAARAGDASGRAYWDAPYRGGPAQGLSQTVAQDAQAGLQTGQSDARQAGRTAQQQVDQGDIKGALDTSNAFGNSLTSYIQGQMELAKAQAAAQSKTIGEVVDAGELAAGIGGEFIAPGNPISTSLITGGGSGLLGGNQGSMLGGIAGQLGKGGSAGAGSSAIPNLPAGYTPSNPGAFSSSPLPSFIDPNAIAAYGPNAPPPPGIFSRLFSSGPSYISDTMGY